MLITEILHYGTLCAMKGSFYTILHGTVFMELTKTIVSYKFHVIKSIVYTTLKNWNMFYFFTLVLRQS